MLKLLRLKYSMTRWPFSISFSLTFSLDMCRWRKSEEESGGYPAVSANTKWVQFKLQNMDPSIFRVVRFHAALLATTGSDLYSGPLKKYFQEVFFPRIYPLRIPKTINYWSVCEQIPIWSKPLTSLLTVFSWWHALDVSLLQIELIGLKCEILELFSYVKSQFSRK